MLLKKTTIINTKLFANNTASNTPSTFLQRVLLARAKSTRSTDSPVREQGFLLKNKFKRSGDKASFSV